MVCSACFTFVALHEGKPVKVRQAHTGTLGTHTHTKYWYHRSCKCQAGRTQRLGGSVAWREETVSARMSCRLFIERGFVT